MSTDRRRLAPASFCCSVWADGAGVRHLLHLMEEPVLYLESGVYRLNNLAVIGATTDAGKLSDASSTGSRSSHSPSRTHCPSSPKHAIVLTNSTSVLIPFRGSSRLNLDELPQRFGLREERRAGLTAQP
jgi:hypothetical protein